MEPEGSFSCSQQRATVRIFSYINPIHAFHFNFFDSLLNVVLIFQLASSLHVSIPELYAQYLLRSTNREATYSAILLVRTPLD
jgi:hypothetical protein